MVCDHNDGCPLKFLGSAWMLEGAILPHAFTALAGEIRTQLIGHVFGEEVGCLYRRACKKNIPLSVTGRILADESVIPL
jgi:hypothetical protein